MKRQSFVVRDPPNLPPSFTNRAAVRRFVRLLLESLETAFFLCNIYLDSYGFLKICDIVNQIIPTAYVYNTGYWVFYNDQRNLPICVCHRFGIRCQHVKSDRHFVNLTPMLGDVQSYFKTPFIGKLYPIFVNIKVTPILSDVLRAYDAVITMTVRPLRFKNNKFVIHGEEKSSFSLEIRYILTPEYCPLKINPVTFSPSPLTHSVFTSYFQSFERFRAFLNKDGCDVEVTHTHTVVSGDLPRLRLLGYDIIYVPTNPPSYPGNNAVIPGAFSMIWNQPEENAYQVSLRGGTVKDTTKHSIEFCRNRLDVVVNGPGYVLIAPKQKRKKTTKRSSRASSKKQPNFVGSNYHDSFPMLLNSSPTHKEAAASCLSTTKNKYSYAERTAFVPTKAVSDKTGVTLHMSTKVEQPDDKVKHCVVDLACSSTKEYPPLPLFASLSASESATDKTVYEYSYANRAACVPSPAKTTTNFDSSSVPLSPTCSVTVLSTIEDICEPTGKLLDEPGTSVEVSTKTCASLSLICRSALLSKFEKTYAQACVHPLSINDDFFLGSSSSLIKTSTCDDTISISTNELTYAQRVAIFHDKTTSPKKDSSIAPISRSRSPSPDAKRADSLSSVKLLLGLEVTTEPAIISEVGVMSDADTYAKRTASVPPVKTTAPKVDPITEKFGPFGPDAKPVVIEKILTDSLVDLDTYAKRAASVPKRRLQDETPTTNRDKFLWPILKIAKRPKVKVSNSDLSFSSSDEELLPTYRTTLSSSNETINNEYAYSKRGNNYRDEAIYKAHGGPELKTLKINYSCLDISSTKQYLPLPRYCARRIL